MKILVADRNLRVTQSLCALLAAKGHQTFAAVTAEEMLHLANAERPYVILLDTDLPDMPGFLPFYHIRNTPEIRETFVILVSDKPTNEKVFWGFSLNSDCHLTRPVESAELILWLTRLEKNLKDWEAEGNIGTPRFEGSDFSRCDQWPPRPHENTGNTP